MLSMGGGGSRQQTALLKAPLFKGSYPAYFPLRSLDDVVMGGISESGFVIRQGGVKPLC